MPLIARVIWRQTLLWNMITSLVSMPGCYLLMEDKIFQGCHNRIRCFESYATVNKCSRILRAQKMIRWRHQGCCYSAVVLPALWQVLCKGVMNSLVNGKHASDHSTVFTQNLNNSHFFFSALWHMFLQTFFFWNSHFLLHSITLHPSILSPTLTPNVPCPKTLNARLLHCLHFEDKDCSLHQTVCAVSRHEVVKPQKRQHTLETGHKNLQMRTMNYHKWLLVSWWNILLPSFTLDTESVNSTETQITSY